MADACAVCCEAFNAAARKQVACQFCHYVACSTCVRAYLLSRPEVAQCMSCHAIWDDEALECGLPRAFLNGAYKAHQADLMLEREKARLPEAQVRAKGELKARKHEAEILALRNSLAEAKKRGDYSVSPWRVNAAIHNLVHRAHLARNGEEAPMEETRFIHRCPKDGCRGFLSENGATVETAKGTRGAHKCGLCDMACCAKCMVPLEAEAAQAHACKPDDVKTVRELAKSTRACPTCAVPITKVSGCDQMFCTSCHTAFSWNTGQIETGRIHNPHYYEWQRRNGAAPREPGDVVCGGLPAYAEVVDWFAAMESYKRMHLAGNSKEYMVVYAAREIMNKAHQTLAHIEAVTVPALRRHQPIGQANMDLRVKYLLGETTDDKMKQELMKRDKAARKNRAMAQVLEMLTTVAGDVLRAHIAMDAAVMDAEGAAAAAESMITQLCEVRDFANEALAKISRRYDCVVTQFHGWDSKQVRAGKEVA